MINRRTLLKSLLSLPFVGPLVELDSSDLRRGSKIYYANKAIIPKPFIGRGLYASHIQNIKVSVNLNRESIIELGRRLPYYRHIQFPVKV